MRRARSGFNLVEIMCCSGLLLVAVLPLLGFLENLTRQSGLTRARIAARSLARAVVERYRVERLGELATRLGTATAGAAAIDADPLLKLPAGPLAELMAAHAFKRSAVLERPPGADPAAVRKGLLTVKVEWTEGTHLRSYELKTLVVDDELPTGWLQEAI